MIDAFRNAPGGTLGGVLSSDPERGGTYAERHGLTRAYRDRDELWADDEVDAVYVSTVNDRHVVDVLDAAAAGKHVLCDKPLAVTVEDAERMVVACRDAGVVLGVNHNLRCAPAHLAVAELVRSGAIGEVRAARACFGTELPEDLRTWRVDSPTAGAGAALDLTTHVADILRFLLDDDIELVVADTAQHGMSSHDIEDAVGGAFRFRGGALATFLDGFALPYATTSVELHGSKGSIFVDRALEDDPVATVTVRDADGTRALDLDASEGLYRHTVRRFNRAVRGEGTPACTGEDGLRSVQAAVAALASAREGRAIRLSA